jgi:hypothetical protein
VKSAAADGAEQSPASMPCHRQTENEANQKNSVRHVASLRSIADRPLLASLCRSQARRCLLNVADDEGIASSSPGVPPSPRQMSLVA